MQYFASCSGNDRKTKSPKSRENVTERKTLNRMNVKTEKFQSTPGIEPGTLEFVGEHQTPPPLPKFIGLLVWSRYLDSCLCWLKCR